MSYDEETTCMSYEEEDTGISYEEEDTCALTHLPLYVFLSSLSLCSKRVSLQ